MKTEFKVGFLVDNLEVNSSTYKIIQSLIENSNFAKPVILFGFTENRKRRVPNVGLKLPRPINSAFNLFTKIITAILYRIVFKTELFFAKKRTTEIGKKHSLKNSDLDIVSLEGEWSNSGLYLRFSNEEIEKINNLQLDCILRCGSGILRGDILSSARLGVLSFHHGDNRIHRGGGSGFWEVLNDEPTSGFIIQRLNEELDGGQIIFRGNVRTAKTWVENKAFLHEKSSIFMVKLLENLSNGGSLVFENFPCFHGYPINSINNPLVIMKYVKKVWLALLFSKLKKELFSKEISDWGIAFAFHRNYNKALSRYKEIAAPGGRSLADPFVFSFNSKHYIFAEDICHKLAKGRISAFEIVDGEAEFLDIILEEDFHLSFPFIFEFDGNVYMVPETHQLNEIRLYKAIDFPLIWKYEKTLMDKVDAADTMIFERNGWWFMLSNICSSDLGDHNSEFHVFSSDDPINGEWKSINDSQPVIFDSSHARNGGFFKYNGDLYRINQIHTRKLYGHSFGINKVIEMSPECYKEERIQVISPKFFKGIRATHHYNGNNEIAVVDFSRPKRLNS